MKSDGLMKWLLEDSEPSIRYLTMIDLLDRSQDDPEVVSAKGMVGKAGWAAQVLEKQTPGGWWANEESLYTPKYISTNWMLLILADLGMTRADPRIAKSSGLWIKRFAKRDGGFGAEHWKKSHLCTVGNTARALVKFGYADHSKVKSAFEWFVKNQAKKGGWSCFGSGRNLDSWEPMSAFAVYPRQKWTRSMKRSVELGAEFFLERELHKQGARYRPWDRFHYPVHYYYDLLVGLDFMTALGYVDDSRLGHAISLLKKKRRRNGRWVSDAVHPDLEGPMAEYYEKLHPIPFSLEPAGQPSKMITFRALRVLKRLGEFN